MRNAIILHGMPDENEYYDVDSPSASNAHWLPWLQKQLLVQDVNAQTPEIPLCYKLDYEDWEREVERYEIGHNTDLVGHSAGAGFWVRYLCEKQSVHVRKVILVAPWLDLTNEYKSGFSSFDADTDVASRIEELKIIVSNDDDASIHETVDWLESNIRGISVIRLDGMGHFTFGSMGTDKFPQLLELLS